MRKTKFIIILTIIILAAAAYYGHTAVLPKIFKFDSANALKEWEEKVFKGKVIYTIKTQRVGGYLQADSDQACSGIFYKIKFDPKKYPMISWKWKIIEFPKKEKVSEGGWMEKDDYPARIYIIFPALIFTNIRSIEYVWDEKLPKDTIMTSPYYGNIKLIVAESGTDKMNRWIPEERNILEDYKKAYKAVPAVVGAIAIMTDADNTMSTAEAQYKDIKVGYANEPAK